MIENLKIDNVENLKKIILHTAHVSSPKLVDKSLSEKIKGLHFLYVKTPDPPIRPLDW